MQQPASFTRAVKCSDLRVQDFSQAAQLEMNKKLELASTFHGLHAIACNIAPVKSSGIEAVECDTFKLFCLQTPTGTPAHLPHHRRRPPPLKRTLQCFWLLSYCNPDAAGVKFLLVTEPAAINQESVLHSIYELYCDYVLKNPFYQAQSRRR